MGLRLMAALPTIAVAATMAVGSAPQKPKEGMRPTRQWRARKSPIHSLAISADGSEIIVGGSYNEGTVDIWKSKDGSRLGTLGKIAKGDTPVLGLCLSRNKRLLAATTDRLEVWNVAAHPRSIGTFAIGSDGSPVAFDSASKEIAFVDPKGQVRIMDSKLRPLGVLRIANLILDDLRLIGKGSLLVATGNPGEAGCQIWDWKKGRQRATVKTFGGRLYPIDENLFAVGWAHSEPPFKGYVTWFDCGTNKTPKQIAIDDDVIEVLHADKKGNLILITQPFDDSSTSLVKVSAAGISTTLLTWPNGWIRAASSGDGRTLVAGTPDGMIRVWQEK